MQPVEDGKPAQLHCPYSLIPINCARRVKVCKLAHYCWTHVGSIVGMARRLKKHKRRPKKMKIYATPAPRPLGRRGKLPAGTSL